jgi:RNA polymerase sigma factor (TIGR02999 family)
MESSKRKFFLTPGVLVSLNGTRIRLDELLPLVYEQLRAYASRALRDEPKGLTLQTTDLVHEVYLRLSQLREIEWGSDNHVMRASVAVMRRVLVDHARSRRAAKRSAPSATRQIDDMIDLPMNTGNPQYSMDELLDLDWALERLAAVDQRKAEVVELRYFGGFSIAEAAELLEVSHATVKRDWVMAKAWLFREMQRNSAHQP